MTTILRSSDIIRRHTPRPARPNWRQRWWARIVLFCVLLQSAAAVYYVTQYPADVPGLRCIAEPDVCRVAAEKSREAIARAGGPALFIE